MSYTTVDQWLTVYPNISKSSVNSATMGAYLEKGSAYIDSYIAPVVSAVPVTPTPPILKDLNDDLSYVMFLRRNVHEAGKDVGIEKMWQDCIRRLEDIRAGRMTLVSSGGSAAAVAPWSSVAGYRPTFGVVKSIESAHGDSNRREDELDD
jgi:hypothetical protein